MSGKAECKGGSWPFPANPGVPRGAPSPAPASTRGSVSCHEPQKSCGRRETETHSARRAPPPKTTHEGNATKRVFLQLNRNTDRHTSPHTNTFLSQGGKAVSLPFYWSWFSVPLYLLGLSPQQFLPKGIQVPPPAAGRRALWRPVPKLPQRPLRKETPGSSGVTRPLEASPCGALLKAIIWKSDSCGVITDPHAGIWGSQHPQPGGGAHLWP